MDHARIFELLGAHAPTRTEVPSWPGHHGMNFVSTLLDLAGLALPQPQMRTT